MTQEEKDLLLRDISARLPYGVKAYVKNWSNFKTYEDVYEVKSAFPSLNEVHVQSETGSLDVLLGYYDYEFKPYLFPMSSITDEQWKEITDIQIQESLKSLDSIGDSMYNPLFSTDDLKTIEWCYANHIDIHDFIPKGLALDATGKNIYEWRS